MFWTTNVTTIDASKVTPEEKITSLELRAWAGQGDVALFRLGNDGPLDLDLLLATTDDNLSLSRDGRRDFAPALSYSVRAGQVGEAVYVKLSAPLDTPEGSQVATITAGAASLPVTYYFAPTDSATSTVPNDYKYGGDETARVLQRFESDGEAVTLLRYDPMPKPTDSDDPYEPDSLQALRNRNVAEWVSPYSEVGYRVKEYHVKAFVGDQNIEQTLKFVPESAPSTDDTSVILLPPTFQGFDDPTVVVYFSQLTPSQKGYQRTQWVMLRRDRKYALVNIVKQNYYRGEFLYYKATLADVMYPGGSNPEGFLPWNQIYDERGKLIHYVRSWAPPEEYG